MLIQYILMFPPKINSKQGLILLALKFFNTIPWHLTYWGQLMHICVGKLTITGSDYGLSPGQCQAIIWTNAGILLTGTSGTNLSQILIRIHTFSFKKMHLKMSSAKWRPFCLGLNVFMAIYDSWLNSHSRKARTYWIPDKILPTAFKMHFCKWKLMYH